MHAESLITCKANVVITARERGKKVRAFCRLGHNRWVNLGRMFLPRTITPNGSWQSLDGSVIRSMGFGIGGNLQTASITGTLATHYPGRGTFDKEDVTVAFLERPIKVSGTAGVGSSAGVWMRDITINQFTPAFVGSPATAVEYMSEFATSDIHLTGAYTSIPISEVGLFLSNQASSLTSAQVYDYGTSPDYINLSTRPKLVAYFPMDPIPKTASIALEVRWQLQF